MYDGDIDILYRAREWATETAQLQGHVWHFVKIKIFGC